MEEQKSTWTSFLKSIATFTGDLSTLTAPSFILSGTSILEYSAYWCEHPTLLMGVTHGTEGERMLAVTKWYCSVLKGLFSARHESAGGERKPLNPVLGEEFKGSWKADDGECRLIAEQVSHHPPISAYRITTSNGVVLQGHNAHKSTFSGRTILVRQVGHSVLTVPLSSASERYLITFPKITLEGLFYGSPYAELTDSTSITSSSGWSTQFTYTGAGWISGKRNTLQAKIFPPESTEPKWVINGQWTDILTIEPSSDDEPFLDCKNPPQRIVPDPPTSEFESRSLWGGVADALKIKDYESVSKLKSAIEVRQREMRKHEKEEGIQWKTKYFNWEEVDPVVEELGGKVGLVEGRWQFNETK